MKGTCLQCLVVVNLEHFYENKSILLAISYKLNAETDVKEDTLTPFQKAIMQHPNYSCIGLDELVQLK